MNVSSGQLARVIAPFPLSGRGSFVTVRRHWRGETLPGSQVAEILARWGYGRASWICSGWLNFDGNTRPLGPEVVLLDACLCRVAPAHWVDPRDRLVTHRKA